MRLWQRRRRVRVDPEVVQLFADEPELLGIVDAVAATQRPPRTRQRRLVPAAVAVAAATTALLVVVPWPGSGGGVVEEALAAVGDGQVIHAIVSTQVPDNVRVDLASASTSPVTIAVETWYDRSSEELRARIRHEGVVVVDTAGPAAGRAVPGVSDLGDRLFVLRYRDALAGGDARVTRRDRLDGRPVIWLDVDLGDRSAQVIIDADSYLPVAFTDVTEQRRRWAVRAFETVSRDEGDFVPDTTPMVPAGGRVVSTSVTNAARVRVVAGFPLVWPGESVADQSLDSVVVETLESADSGNPSRGVAFRYRGDADLLVRVAPRPEPALGFVRRELTFGLNPIPADTMIDVIRGDGSWLGQMRSRDLYVAIESSRLDVVVAAARALTPLR